MKKGDYMRITIKDIASSLGISYTTVSRALNNHPEISEATKEKVRNTARDLGYMRNEMARGLVKSNSQTIGVLIQDITNPYFANIVRGIEDYCQEMRFATFLGNSDWNPEKEKDYIRWFLSKQVDGLLINPVNVKTRDMLCSLNLSIPVVLAATIDVTNTYPCVGVDNEGLTHMVTEYLINLQHKDIVFLGGNENITGIIPRITGYSKVMEKNHLEKKILTSSVGLTRESGRIEGLKLLEMRPLPTAVITANDNIALGLMEVLGEKGITVPDDISIISSDNIDIASLHQISLTTVDQPKYELGVLAAKILINRILNIPDDYPQQNVLPFSLKERNSTRRNIKSNDM